jgi:hypothetical protein
VTIDSLRAKVSPVSAALVISILVSASTLAVNIRLRREIRELQTALDNQAVTEAPQEGSYLRVLKGTDRNGSPKQIDLTSLHSPILAIVMSPQCHYYRTETSTWSHLLKINKSARPLFINLSGQDDTQFLSTLQLPTK